MIAAAPEDIGKERHHDRISHVVDKPAAPKRLTKAERIREEMKSAVEGIRGLAESKPTRKQLRDYFASRIKELNDGD